MRTEIYHVLSRGVDKRQIFMDDKDRLCFIHDLFEFNDEDKVLDTGYFFSRSSQSLAVGQPEIAGRERKRRKMIVYILAFCLMPNHYHLLLQPRIENGVPLFMKKLNGGYVQYFNGKHKRSGALFQSKYKRILVTEQSHFIHLPYYIHCNPLDLVMPQWREGKIENAKKAFAFLNTYRWSSFLDYIGVKNFPSVTQREFLSEFYGGPAQYEKEMVRWLRSMSLDAIAHLTFE